MKPGWAPCATISEMGPLLLARVLEGLYRLLGKRESPLLSSARIKFLGLNLDYCIDRARRELKYDPQIDFAQAMPQTVEWFCAAESKEPRTK